MKKKNRRYLCLDLGLNITGVAYADGNLFNSGFGGSPLAAVIMPKSHRRFCVTIQQIIMQQRIDVVVVGLPPPVSNALPHSRSNRRKLLAIAARMRKFLASSSESMQKCVLLEFFDESFSTYAVKSEARFLRLGSKGNAQLPASRKKVRVGKTFPASGGGLKKSAKPSAVANLDSLAALEILNAYLNFKLTTGNN